METRLIIAYTLIALLSLAAFVFSLVVVRNRRAHRRRMQGHRS